MPMNTTLKVAIIGGTFTLAGIVVGQIVPLIEAITKVADTSGETALSFKGSDLPRPTPKVAAVLKTLTRTDVERVLAFQTVQADNIGLIETCLTDASKSEMDALSRLQALGLGTVVRREDEAGPKAMPTLQADSPDANGNAFCSLTPDIIDTICSSAALCPDRYAFTPSSDGLDVRSYLRALLEAQVTASAD